jgi:hypothetical protein
MICLVLAPSFPFLCALSRALSGRLTGQLRRPLHRSQLLSAATPLNHSTQETRTAETGVRGSRREEWASLGLTCDPTVPLSLFVCSAPLRRLFLLSPELTGTPLCWIAQCTLQHTPCVSLYCCWPRWPSPVLHWCPPMCTCTIRVAVMIASVARATNTQRQHSTAQHTGFRSRLAARAMTTHDADRGATEECRPSILLGGRRAVG